MNENWPEIVETLIPYFETNSVEGDYQREIENCLKFLVHEKYQRAQKPLGNGRFLMTCSNTKTKKRDIERIAKALGIQVTVEIV